MSRRHLTLLNPNPEDVVAAEIIPLDAQRRDDLAALLDDLADRARSGDIVGVAMVTLTATDVGVTWTPGTCEQPILTLGAIELLRARFTHALTS
jgi:hypothetical protein